MSGPCFEPSTTQIWFKALHLDSLLGITVSNMCYVAVGISSRFTTEENLAKS
jgi:hypothetical protein